MKSVSVQTAATLAGNVHLGASLFGFFLDTPLCLTDAGMDIIFDAGDGLGAQTYLSARSAVDGGASVPAVRRGRSRLALSVAPDDVEITLDLGALANGQGLRLAAVRGAFDGRRVRVQKLVSRLFAGDASSGAITDVDGPGYVSDVSSVELRLTVKARTDLLSRPLPPRVVAPGCPWQLYGPGCELSVGSFSESRTVAAGATASSIPVTVAPSRAFAGSLVWFTSGANVGIQRNVKQGGSPIVPTVAFPYQPAPGDTLTIALGCDRTRQTCQTTFANRAHFGGFPDVPSKGPNVTV